mgnify:CR=1 FL=1
MTATNTPLDVAGLSGSIVSVSANLPAQQFQIGVALVGLDGTGRGEVRLGIGPQAQPDTPTQNPIPSFEEFMTTDPDAQAAFAAIQKFGLKFLDLYSKEINLPAPAPAPAAVPAPEPSGEPAEG